MKKAMYLFTLVSLIVVLMAPSVNARSGCCSHHGGVCGCGCCDGSPLSAICAPYYPECNGGGIEYNVPTQVPYIPPTAIIYPTETPPLITDTMYEPTIEVTPQEADSSSESNENELGNILSIPILTGVGYLVYRARKNK